MRSLIRKNDEIELTLVDKNVGIAGFTETWCKDEHPDVAMPVNGYNLVCHDRGDGRGGVINSRQNLITIRR